MPGSVGAGRPAGVSDFADATSASMRLASLIVGRSSASVRSSCISSAVSAPAWRGGCTLPSATSRSSANWFCRSGNGGPPSTASYSVAPKEKTSDLNVGSWPLATSGAR